ncbi:hypothetical protein [Cytobacillus stercorigallinarum]|nr:hypothetical protein [Cytobacillus stercorigallinarum]
MVKFSSEYRKKVVMDYLNGGGGKDISDVKAKSKQMEEERGI